MGRVARQAREELYNKGSTLMPLKISANQAPGLARLAILSSLATLVLVNGVGCPGAAPGGGYGGGGGGGGPIDNGPVSFAEDIQPVLLNACTSCHSPGGSAFEGSGIPMDLTQGNAYDAIVGKFSVQNPALTLVVPGDAENSLLYQKVSSNTPPVGVRMPRLLPQLEQDEIDLIERWINEGALDN